MYYVNVEDIKKRLDAMPELEQALVQLAQEWQGTLLQGLAQERVLHLCIETVTDVGSCLIDGYLMRDASSYEDIIEIIGGEGVIQRGAGEESDGTGLQPAQARPGIL